jgi:hypothetical protein
MSDVMPYQPTFQANQSESGMVSMTTKGIGPIGILTFYIEVAESQPQPKIHKKSEAPPAKNLWRAL